MVHGDAHSHGNDASQGCQRAVGRRGQGSGKRRDIRWRSRHECAQEQTNPVKRPVHALIERGGEACVKHVADVTAKTSASGSQSIAPWLRRWASASPRTGWRIRTRPKLLRLDQARHHGQLPQRLRAALIALLRRILLPLEHPLGAWDRGYGKDKPGNQGSGRESG